MSRIKPSIGVILVKHRILLLALLASMIGLSGSRAQDSEFYKKPTTAAEYWRALQFEISVGKFDIANDHLRGLLNQNPTDAELLTIEAKDGLIAFLRLRNVERWSRDKTTDKESRDNVEKLIGLVSTALKNELSNPVRISKFARNLSATPEEAGFALKELTRSGVDAIPVLIDLLRGNQPPAQRAAILNAIKHFDISVVPALVASLDAPEGTLKLEILDALRNRADYTTFSTRAETDLMPYLWNFSATLPRNPELLRKKAREMLLGLLDTDPYSDRVEERRLPQWRLAQLTQTFLDHKARFTAPDQSTVWRWDGERPAATPMSISDAEEYFGLRYARWALEMQADYAPAQKAFITLALDKHFGRAGTDVPLSKSSPALYGILASAPYPLLLDLTESYLREDRLPLAIALLQVIGDRGETKAARPSDKPDAVSPNEIRPSLLLKAMDHPNPRVLFAAIDALLKAPGPTVHQRASSIVKILAGLLQANAPDESGKPRVLIGDPDHVRAEMLAAVMRRAGFEVEVTKTGRDTMRRLQAKNNIDLIVLDHHLPYPLFADTLSQVRADFRSTGLPVLVVASPDEPTTAHPITLLARLAALAAAQEHFEFMKADRSIGDPARAAPAYRFKLRLDAVRKWVEAAGIRVSADVENRLEYLVYLTVPLGEFPLGFEFEKIALELEKARLFLPAQERADRMNALLTSSRGGRIAVNESPFSNSRELTPALANIVARNELSLSHEIIDLAKTYWQIIQSGQQDKDGKFLQLPLPGVAVRHRDAEERANRLIRGQKRVRVIPEVFTEEALKEELRGFFAMQDPKVVEADKKENARAAMEWLRKMAVGELTGYPIVDAEATLRQALQNPELAGLAIDAVSRLPGKEAQQDMASVVLGPLDPPLRALAADALIKQIQQRGKMISVPQQQLLVAKAADEADPQVKNRLLALSGILQPDARETGNRIMGFTPGPAPEKKEAPKN